MLWLVAITGIAYGLMGLAVALRPALVAAMQERILNSGWLFGASLILLLLGSLYIAVGDRQLLPAPLAWLGWLMVMKGLLMVVIPVRTLRQWGQTTASIPAWLLRAMAVLLAACGLALAWIAL